MSEPGSAALVAPDTLVTHFDVACVKLGAAGAIAIRDGRLERTAPDQVLDTAAFGAGDAFAGAFLVALARDEPLDRALRLACDAGTRAAA